MFPVVFPAGFPATFPGIFGRNYSQLEYMRCILIGEKEQTELRRVLFFSAS